MTFERSLSCRRSEAFCNDDRIKFRNAKVEPRTGRQRICLRSSCAADFYLAYVKRFQKRHKDFDAVRPPWTWPWWRPDSLCLHNLGCIHGRRRRALCKRGPRPGPDMDGGSFSVNEGRVLASNGLLHTQMIQQVTPILGRT